MNRTIYLKTASWNSHTFDSTTGGALKLDFDHGGEELSDRTGDDQYPEAVFVVNKYCKASLTIRENYFTDDPGTMSNLTGTLSGSADVPVSFSNMVFINTISSQDRATLGQAVLNFSYQSTDGQTSPLS